MIVYYSYIDGEKHSFLLDNYIDSFSSEFKQRVLRYRRWQDAQLSLLGRLLLKKGLEENFEINHFEIDYTNNKKPFLKGLDVQFNISHAHDIVACVLSRSNVGIDIEYIDKGIDIKSFESQMTNNEFQKVTTSVNTEQSFFTYWTEKEAVIKSHGKGLFIPLKSFEILEDIAVIDNQKFYVKKIDIDSRYKCCIATSDKKSDLEKIKLQEIDINKL
ncbi:4'-phosphopantetheinyl transferase family protein [Flavobacterium columnare]|uniref:4'-phosphopantetheinyl transferase family protein n=1 Tax=Flavobacterium columnare TaxID=996 RepID=UPI0040337DCB